MKTDLFQSCGHCWLFQICWHIECSTFTASSFRIWNSSTRIPSPPPFKFSFFNITGWGIDLDYCDIEWFALDMSRDHSVIFEIVPKYLISDSFVDYDGCSISSKRFLPTVLDIMVIWINLPILAHFSSLIPKMSMFTLAIPCLTASNLPWFMELMFQVPMQYCSLQHLTLLPPPVTSTTGHCFHLASSLHSFWSYFSTLLQ